MVDKKDLIALKKILERWENGKNIRNVNVLLSEQRLMGKNGKKASKLKYELYRSTPITFHNIDVGGHSIPKGIEKDPNKNIALNVVMIHEEDSNTSEIRKLNVNFRLFGKPYKHTLIYKEAYSSWHLDMDSTTEEQMQKSRKKGTYMTHPLFHLTFGGLQMNRGEFGQLLLLDTPRLVHYPMDIVLTIDFVLRNFYVESRHKAVTADRTYQRIVKSSCVQYLKPYYESISKAIDSKTLNMPLIPSLSY